MTDVRHSGTAALPNRGGGTAASSTSQTARGGARSGIPNRIARIARWGLAVLACLWMSLCTAVGPLYWEDSSIAQFGWRNAVYGVLSFAVYGGIVVALVRFGSASRRAERPWHALMRLRIHTRAHTQTHTPTRHLRLAQGWRRTAAFLQAVIIRGTNRRWKIALILFLVWLWVPTTLLSAFGADLRSQTREFSWAWNQWMGQQQPYIGFFSFVPMDIYPTAHYLWPADPTYLSDQHNLVLTVIYGAFASVSRYVTGTNDAGFVALSALQMLFAVFCCAATANRFFNLPWQFGDISRQQPPAALTLRGKSSWRLRHPESANPWNPMDLMRPERGMRPGMAGRWSVGDAVSQPCGAVARALILLFFAVCPLAVFSTISLTKSPLFAFAFVWWFGIGYELHATWSRHGPRAIRPGTLAALMLSTSVMLISAKYAWYLVAVQIVLLFIADRRRWKAYVVGLLLPLVVLHGALVMLISSGAVIGGDPIESRGIQLQQIARVAKLNPDGIPESARVKISRVFNLDQMADAYFPQDADPVKSSGIQSKKVSYKWRAVTAKDMEGFNSAWIEIIAANPTIALDAFLAKTYGYFNVTDMPYVSMDYYVANDHVQVGTTWIKAWQHDWRDHVAQAARQWSSLPVLGWLTHGNLYVSLTLLIGAAEVLLRRWRTLIWHVPLLLLMGVMITAPANNFDRHMLPVAFVFGFLALTFWRESCAARLKS